MIQIEGVAPLGKEEVMDGYRNPSGCLHAFSYSRRQSQSTRMIMECPSILTVVGVVTIIWLLKSLGVADGPSRDQ